ncbi:O-methyltransferase [Fusarium agapanthi]|uniref:O-methyltransferase n=1 Tax=Fusarium agapanthi TaxID=1803897 RepID=A0A9P5B191_9HYPO|nr:O-methyltransferase [Fusarium agapanthi]
MPDFDFNAIAAAASFDNFREAPILDTLANDTLLSPNSKLEQALSNSEAKGLPPISVTPMSGQHLSILTQLMGAKSVLEIGTLGGYSAICFAQGGAKVLTLTLYSELRLTVLPKLAEETRQFDMVFIDAEFEDHIEHFDWAVKLTRPGGCVFFDDVVPAIFKNGEVKPGADSILTHIGKDRVKAALMPNVVCHPMLPAPIFNGFVLALVKEH